MKSKQKAILALEDGAVFEGWSFGCFGEKAGEVVFNTSMTGYQEILTDPSYKGQIVIMTYPLIGNYGINQEDIESQGPKVEGFVVKENSLIFSNWRGDKSLSDYLIRHGIMGVEGMDTRAITKHIRMRGAMKAVLSSDDLDRNRLIEKAKASPGLIGRDLVKEVTCGKSFSWASGKDAQFSSPYLHPPLPASGRRWSLSIMGSSIISFAPFVIRTVRSPSSLPLPAQKPFFLIIPMEFFYPMVRAIRRGFLMPLKRFANWLGKNRSSESVWGTNS
jgi:hypothetical protein